MFVIQCIPADLIWISKHRRQIQLYMALADMNLDGENLLLQYKKQFGSFPHFNQISKVFSVFLIWALRVKVLLVLIQ